MPDKKSENQTEEKGVEKKDKVDRKIKELNEAGELEPAKELLKKIKVSPTSQNEKHHEAPDKKKDKNQDREI